MPTSDINYTVTKVINIYDGVHATDGYRTYYGNTIENQEGGKWNARMAYIAQYGLDQNGFHYWCARQLALWTAVDVGQRALVG